MNNPVSRISPEQLEALTDLGRRLQHLREMKELSLEQVAASTLVSKRMLAAIEQARVEHLPEPVYIQGFIRRYADVLGVNGAALASEFPAETPLTEQRQSMTKRFPVQAQLRPLHLYLLYMVLVGIAISSLSYILNRTASPIVIGAVQTDPIAPIAPASPNPTNGPNPSGGNPGNNPANPSSPNGSSAVPNTAAEKTVRVAVKLTDQSWIRVMTDGKMDFEGVLPQGTQRLWTADKQIVVRAGNAGGVIVSLNNGQAKPLGEPGSVEEVTFGGNTQASEMFGQVQTIANSRVQHSF